MLGVQIEPKEREIRELKTQIDDMENEELKLLNVKHELGNQTPEYISQYSLILVISLAENRNGQWQSVYSKKSKNQKPLVPTL